MFTQEWKFLVCIGVHIYESQTFPIFRNWFLSQSFLEVDESFVDENFL